MTLLQGTTEIDGNKKQHTSENKQIWKAKGNKPFGMVVFLYITLLFKHQ